MNQKPCTSTREILDQIDQDIEQRPETIRPLDGDLMRQARALTDGVELDLGASLDES